MVTLLESVICWFPGLSEALIEGIRGVTRIILLDNQRKSKLRIANQEFSR